MLLEKTDSFNSNSRLKYDVLEAVRDVPVPKEISKNLLVDLLNNRMNFLTKGHQLILNDYTFNFNVNQE